MRPSVVLLALLLLPLSIGAQTPADPPTLLLEDAAGDVSVYLYDTSQSMPGPWDAVDLRSLSMREDPDVLHITVGIHGLPECSSGSCVNAGDLRTHFTYGTQEYVLQQGIDLQGNVYALLNSQNGNSFQLTRIDFADADLDEAALTITAHVPREWVLDESGSPLRKDTEITDIYTYSYSQFSLGGPDLTDMNSPPRDMFVTRDDMGQDAPASFPITTGGVWNQGPVFLTSAHPYRASNGGQATYRFDLQAMYDGGGEALFDLEFDGIPDTWTVERPEGLLRLPSGVPGDFSILVSTPFGHSHGGSEPFRLRIVDRMDPEVWAEVELGLHYLAVPQPAGHHPTLYFHSVASATPNDVVSPTLGGINGQSYMNTLEDDDGDQQIATQGWTSLPFQDRARFAVCLQPGLLMGLDFNRTLTGLAEFSLESTAPLQDVVVTGRLLRLAPGDDLGNCVHSLYNGRDETVLAELEASAPTAVGGATSFSLTVVPTADGDYVPFEDGATLVLELEATPTYGLPSDAGPGGQLSAKLLPGGRITLPLDEYYDARPAGLVGATETTAVADDDVPDDTAFEGPEPTKDSPVGVLPLLAVAALTLAARQRRA